MSNYLDVVYDPPGRNCKDCISEFTFCQRPSPHPGPRCKTHALAKRNAARRTKHQSYVEKQFNLPPGDYDKLKEYQAGKCAICQRATGKTRNLAVDHDHKHCDDCKGSTSCGKGVRGLLCMRCNSLLAHIRDNKETARRVFEYLDKPPYQLMTMDRRTLEELQPEHPDSMWQVHEAFEGHVAVDPVWGHRYTDPEDDAA